MQNLAEMTAGCLHTGSHFLTVIYSTKYGNRAVAKRMRDWHYEECDSSRSGTEEKMFTMPTINMAATGRNIATLRTQAGLTVKDLQEVFGFATPQAIYKWQHGTAMPTLDNLIVLAMVLGVAMDDIVVVDVDAKAQIGA